MNTQRDNILDNPAAVDVSVQRGISEWISRTQGMLILDTTSKGAFTKMVNASGVRTRCLPGETHMRFNRFDLERVAREAVRVGLPQQSA